MPVKIVGEPAERANFSKHQNIFCRDMPIAPAETHQKVWHGGDLNVSLGPEGVLRNVDGALD
jgi:hypothetical protein